MRLRRHIPDTERPPGPDGTERTHGPDGTRDAEDTVRLDGFPLSAHPPTTADPAPVAAGKRDPAPVAKADPAPVAAGNPDPAPVAAGKPDPAPVGKPDPAPVADRPRRDTRGGATSTVRVARRRFLRRQWARRWSVWRRLVTALVLLALIVTGIWLVFFSSVLAVSGVQVAGTHQLSPTAVRRAAAVPTGKPLARVDLGAVSARVERLPAVRRVDVSRAWPDRVRVDVTERRPVAVVQEAAGGGLQAVDSSGVLFRHYATRPPGLPLIRRTVGTGKDALAEAATVAGSLPPALTRRVAYVSVATVDRISLGMRSGRTVLWGSADASTDKARVLELLLAHQASYYDVSVPGQPVLRK